MQQVIIAIHLMVVTALVVLVLYQKSEGGALGMGGSGVFTGRGQANALTRATGILATLFFITSIALTVLPAWERRGEGGEDWTKALDQGTIKLKEVPKTEGKGEQGAPEKAPEPGKDSIFDQLQRAQQKRQQQSAPAETPPSAAAQPTAPTPPAAETPAQQAPAAEAPKAAAPVEAPKAEAPKPQAVTPEPAKSEAPAAPAETAPTATPPAAEAPKPEASKPDASKSEAPAVPPAQSRPVDLEAKPAAPESKPAEPENKPAPPTTWKAPTQ
jgi:protein translocase SecG subunit